MSCAVPSSPPKTTSLHQIRNNTRNNYKLHNLPIPKPGQRTRLSPTQNSLSTQRACCQMSSELLLVCVLRHCLDQGEVRYAYRFNLFMELDMCLK
ncbi:hypothetical protein K443DRAFT_592323 [Laccaria amethystina LaAM-08-1]|uniref:Uncharacterized protein n=1 Tax=Laccaria amethystina LaAM-08-1 TaxID=1095629 RepID=A0A0C9WL40_9AGAR|nr:hypothetical protein K443DRAFT_592323 [Laccaria amethystina LaAM-08-1]